MSSANWLAVEFRTSGWDIKAFFRMLVTSATYRQAAVMTPRKLKADLAKALFSLPAVLGVEYGVGFGCAVLRGSENNDLFYVAQDGTPPSDRRIATRTNRHGGMLGGISSGMPIVLRAAVKPTSSLPREQETVTTRGEPTTISTKGRHDPCLLPRFVPMAEAMVAIVLADHWLRWKASGRTSAGSQETGDRRQEAGDT